MGELLRSWIYALWLWLDCVVWEFALERALLFDNLALIFNELKLGESV